MTAALDINGLRYRYADAAPAVRDFSLSVASGELVALLGPSGCGKTTLLKLICGLLTPDAGDIALDGRSILGLPPERRGTALVFQQGRLFEHMSVAANVGFGLRMRGRPRDRIRAAVDEVLAQVQLRDLAERRPRTLSGGQRQRVALARALVTQPHVLLLDEALTALDASLRDDMRALVRQLQRERGQTTLFVTHDQQEAVQLGDRIALMLDGRLEMVDQPAAFFERPVNRTVAAFFGATNFIDARIDAGYACTPFGRLRLDHPADRTAGTLTIRPEAVRAGPGPNALTLRVRENAYRGTHVRCWLTTGEAVLVADMPPDQAPVVGRDTVVHLPPAALWPLPASSEPVA